MNMSGEIDSVCGLIGDIPHSAVSAAWEFIFHALSYWYLVIPGLVLWVVLEIIFRNQHDFNSENGFSPIFNSFIGAGFFLLFETLIDWILHLILGNGVSCGLLWIRSFYLIPFLATGLLLHSLGFWPYLKLPFTGEKIDLFGRRKQNPGRPKAVKGRKRKWRKYR